MKNGDIYNNNKRSNVISGSVWMVGLTLLLFFLPIINGFIGGLVGGYKVGTPRRALTAAILPAIFASIGLWLLLVILDLPIIGLITGMAIGVLILFSDIGIFIGALIGGMIRVKRSNEIIN